MRFRQAKKIFTGDRISTRNYKQPTMDRARRVAPNHYVKWIVRNFGGFLPRRKATPADLGGDTSFTVTLTWDGE